MNQDNNDFLGYAGEVSDYSNTLSTMENTSGYHAPAEDHYGMNQEDYDSYVANRKETLSLCNGFHSFYAANPAYQIEL